MQTWLSSLDACGYRVCSPFHPQSIRASTIKPPDDLGLNALDEINCPSLSYHLPDNGANHRLLNTADIDICTAPVHKDLARKTSSLPHLARSAHVSRLPTLRPAYLLRALPTNLVDPVAPQPPDLHYAEKEAHGQNSSTDARSALQPGVLVECNIYAKDAERNDQPPHKYRDVQDPLGILILGRRPLPAKALQHDDPLAPPCTTVQGMHDL